MVEHVLSAQKGPSYEHPSHNSLVSGFQTKNFRAGISSRVKPVLIMSRITAYNHWAVLRSSVFIVIRLYWSNEFRFCIRGPNSCKESKLTILMDRCVIPDLGEMLTN